MPIIGKIKVVGVIKLLYGMLMTYFGAKVSFTPPTHTTFKNLLWVWRMSETDLITNRGMWLSNACFVSNLYRKDSYTEKNVSFLQCQQWLTHLSVHYLSCLLIEKDSADHNESGFGVLTFPFLYWRNRGIKINRWILYGTVFSLCCLYAEYQENTIEKNWICYETVLLFLAHVYRSINRIGLNSRSRTGFLLFCELTSSHFKAQSWTYF